MWTDLLGHLLVLSAQDDLGIQWINYGDRELNPRSCETPALCPSMNIWKYIIFVFVFQCYLRYWMVKIVSNLHPHHSVPLVAKDRKHNLVLLIGTCSTVYVAPRTNLLPIFRDFWSERFGIFWKSWRRNVFSWYIVQQTNGYHSHYPSY